MENPLSEAIQSGIEANLEIGASFERIGNGGFPNGFVEVAYRDANEQIAKALREGAGLAAILAILASMRARVLAEARAELYQMIEFGMQEANRQLGFYGEGLIDINPLDLSSEVEEAIAALDASLSAQVALVQALYLTDAENELIVGDDGTGGAVRPADIAALLALFVTSLLWAGFDWVMNAAGVLRGNRYKKIAIAIIDDRTTQTCRRVHGQVRNIDQPFHLTGSPRYADYMDYPAFHRWCRTSVALFDERYDDGLSDMLIGEGDDEGL